MARLTARIKRLEALDGTTARGEFAHLSVAELEAQICEDIKQTTDEWRERLRGGASIADILAETDWSADDPVFPLLLAEAQAPAFDADRFLAAVDGQPASSGADEPDALQ